MAVVFDYSLQEYCIIYCRNNNIYEFIISESHPVSYSEIILSQSILPVPSAHNITCGTWLGSSYKATMLQILSIMLLSASTQKSPITQLP